MSLDAADEYLEIVLKDTFNRELDVDENVARTLPFFAAAFAFAGPMFTYIIAEMPPFDASLLGIFLRILLLAAAVSACIVLGNLFRAVRRRDYKIPPSEPELLEYAEGLASAYQAAGLTPKFVQLRAKEKLRELMTRHYAEDTAHNRLVNASKLKARAEGFTWLVIMLGIAFLMIGIMFVADEVSELRKLESNNVANSTAEIRGQGQARLEAEAVCNASGQDIQQVDQKRGGDDQGQVADGAPRPDADARSGATINNALEPHAPERPQMSDPDKSDGGRQTPPQQPISPAQPAPIAHLPQPPAGQILKKSN